MTCAVSCGGVSKKKKARLLYIFSVALSKYAFKLQGVRDLLGGRVFDGPEPQKKSTGAGAPRRGRDGDGGPEVGNGQGSSGQHHMPSNGRNQDGGLPGLPPAYFYHVCAVKNETLENKLVLAWLALQEVTSLDFRSKDRWDAMQLVKAGFSPMAELDASFGLHNLFLAGVILERMAGSIRTMFDPDRAQSFLREAANLFGHSAALALPRANKGMLKFERHVLDRHDSLYPEVRLGLYGALEVYFSSRAKPTDELREKYPDFATLKYKAAVDFLAAVAKSPGRWEQLGQQTVTLVDRNDTSLEVAKVPFRVVLADMFSHVLKGVLKTSGRTLKFADAAPLRDRNPEDPRTVVRSAVKDLVRVTPSSSPGLMSAESQRAWVDSMQEAATVCQRIKDPIAAHYTWGRVARVCERYGDTFLPDSARAYLISYEVSCERCLVGMDAANMNSWVTQAEIARRGLSRVFERLSPDQRQHLMPDVARVAEFYGTSTPALQKPDPPADITQDLLFRLLPIPKKKPPPQAP